VTVACYAADFKQLIILPDAATAVKHVAASHDGFVSDYAAVITPDGVTSQETVVTGVDGRVRGKV
jgi:hypothetical protein